MRALITGAAGQDGILLAQSLLHEGCAVTGLVKPGTDTGNLQRYAPSIEILECDLADSDALGAAVDQCAPDEIYNFGGVSSIVESVENPALTQRVNVGAVETLLRSMRPGTRFVQAASGTIFEGTDISPQNEGTPRSPRTPYAQAKARSLELIDEARKSGVFATAAILYNHESPLRGEGFVTRRITQGAARIAAGLQDDLELGNIDVSRDWGWAPDYVRGMQAMLRAPVPHDYVLATGMSHMLTEFIELAFRAAGIEDWRSVVRTNEGLRRQTDPVLLCGDSSRAYAELGWRHTRTFAQIAQEMVAYDQALIADPHTLWRES